MRLTRSTLTALTAAAALFAAAPLTFAADNASSSDQHNGARHEQNSANASSSSSENSQSQTRKGNAQSSAQAPEGWVLLEEDVVAVTVKEPQNHFLQAERDLANNDRKGAAAEMRIASGYMDMQASRDQGQDKQQLQSAADDVRKAADEVAKSGGNDSGQLKQAFDKADLALAQHFQAKAESELQGQKSVMAGHDLQAAADSLENAVAWSGQQPQSNATSAIANAQQLAVQLIGPESSSSGNRSAAGQAQQASAKQGSSAQGDNATATANAEIPKDASKTVQALGDAIRKYDSSGTNSSTANAGDKTGTAGKQ